MTVVKTPQLGGTPPLGCVEIFQENRNLTQGLGYTVIICVPIYGALAQMGERLTGSQEVRSSILLGSTKILNPLNGGFFMLNDVLMYTI